MRRWNIAFEPRRAKCGRNAATKFIIITVSSIDVRKGEVLGGSGLTDAGCSELPMTIFGAWQGRSTGEILVEGKRGSVDSPLEAIENGIGFVTKDCKRFGFILDQIISNNMTLSAL